MALTNKLSAIGDAIREKTGKTDLMTLDEMPIEIASITTGGGGAEPPEEAFNFTGDCGYTFTNNKWTWFINAYGNKITTKDITNANNMFNYCRSLEHIPFVLNFKSDTNIDMSSAFNYCDKLKQPPQLVNVRPTNITRLFSNCQSIREYPENYGADWNWSYMESQTSSYLGNSSNIFDSNNSLRKLPMELLKHQNPYLSSSYSIYSGLMGFCHNLDEAVNIPVPYTQATWTSNAFQNSFIQVSRLKNFTFATNDDGTPVAVKWKSQTVDFSRGVGYAISSHVIVKSNSGITKDKEVKDDATYQALKNDPDWFSAKIEYSRYNHDSAVATINSLPDTSAYLASAGGTNTIKFEGACGALTDGGAISNLTEEEIAVATAKGWTVTLV